MVVKARERSNTCDATGLTTVGEVESVSDYEGKSVICQNVNVHVKIISH